MNWTYRLAIALTLLAAKLLFRFRIMHREKLLLEGPALIAANHVSYFDPPLVAITFPIPIHFLARSSLYSNAFARWLFPRLNVIPVDQERPEIGAMKTVLRLLKENKHVLIFPEGNRSEDGGLQPAEAGTGFMVAKSGAPVIPIRIFGAYEALPRSSKKIRLRKITTVVGDPIRFTPEELGGGKEAYKVISERIMEAIARLECPPDRVPKPR
ncbi:MAG: 1-acyl-sn-glycerol-3-phosphate acyltransferase [Verrucomicrobiales bacterium]|nr:1-acyl-sn-glycerol-3-phosphate acyltransferase [Verrucomicrobiales bacterium]